MTSGPRPEGEKGRSQAGTRTKGPRREQEGPRPPGGQRHIRGGCGVTSQRAYHEEKRGSVSGDVVREVASGLGGSGRHGSALLRL